MRVGKGIIAAGIAIGVGLVGAAMMFASTGHDRPLSVERYVALDEMYTAMIALEPYRVPRATRDEVLRACDQLDRTDRLLAAKRLECRAQATFSLDHADTALCRKHPKVRPCRSLRARDRSDVAKVIARIEASNRVVNAITVAPACRRAMRTSAEELRLLDQILVALRRLERWLQTGAQADLDRAIDPIPEGAGEDALTGRQVRDRFRLACS